MINAKLKQLAKDNPTQFIQLINSIQDIHALADYIEILGEEISDEVLVLPLFKRLLKHVHLLVREAALTAISNFYINKPIPKDILDRVKAISNSDPSSEIRDLAIDLLKELK